MSRDWFAVYAATTRKPKYRRLTIPGRAALLHVWMLAGGQDPEACWRADELRETLELDGYPGDVLDELIAREWLDVDDQRLWVHDWDAHQQAVTEKVRSAYERERKQDWRLRKKEQAPSLPAPSLPNTTGTQHGQDITASPIVRDVSGTPPRRKPTPPRPQTRPAAASRVNPDQDAGAFVCANCGRQMALVDADRLGGPGDYRYVHRGPCPTAAAA